MSRLSWMHVGHKRTFPGNLVHDYDANKEIQWQWQSHQPSKNPGGW